MENEMILQVTDEEETLVLEFIDLDDLKAEGILPKHLSDFTDR
jgi:hypothetical protein